MLSDNSTQSIASQDSPFLDLLSTSIPVAERIRVVGRCCCAVRECGFQAVKHIGHLASSEVGLGH
jgi:hypothetical protein